MQCSQSVNLAVLQSCCCCVTADLQSQTSSSQLQVPGLRSQEALCHHNTMVCAARLSQILVKRGAGGALPLLKAGPQGAALLYSPSWRRMSSQQSARGDRVGPDRILPANSLSTTWPDGAVEIRFSDKHPLCQEKPISVSILKSQNLKSNNPI